MTFEAAYMGKETPTNMFGRSTEQVTGLFSLSSIWSMRVVRRSIQSLLREYQLLWNPLLSNNFWQGQHRGDDRRSVGEAMAVAAGEEASRIKGTHGVGGRHEVRPNFTQ
jgi:histone acetyltransferase (RNA polymerase elongator complex component)